jgi:hypothetical protein
LREPERERALEPPLHLHQHLPLRLPFHRPRHLLPRQPLRRSLRPHDDDDDAPSAAARSTLSSTR